MNKNYILKVLGGLEELNMLQTGENCKWIVSVQIDSYNYGLLIYSLESCRISFLKLTLNELHYSNLYSDSAVVSASNSEKNDYFKVYFMKVFCLPFILLDVVSTSQNIWAIGQDTVVDLNPHIELALKEDGNGDCMETDEIPEFDHKTFETVINVHQFRKYDFQVSDTFIGCNFINYGFVKCHKNSNRKVWQLELALVKDRTKSSNVNSIPILDIPMLFDNSRKITVVEDHLQMYDPVVLLIQHDDPWCRILQNIFEIKCSTSICLIGHPDGSLLWTCYDFNVNTHSSPKLQTLYNMNQSIIGIHFVDDIGQFQPGCGVLLIVGALGQITLFSSRKLPSFTLVPGKQPFWVTTVHLKLSITSSSVANNCLLYSSEDGTLWMTDLLMLLNLNLGTNELCSASQPSKLCGVKQIIAIDKSSGLLLLSTVSGNVYLTVCRKDDSSPMHSSLPSLMNECLQQSIVMQELQHVKFLQSRLFAALSIFTSLKFANIIKDPIIFSITEVALQPKKYMFVIDLKFLEKLHLDSELCHINVSVFTYFQTDYTLVSKTVPYSPDQMSLCLELTDTILQPPFVSMFPIFVEVGVILQLPDEWKIMDCFKLISSCLPFYLRVQSFMVHELNLIQGNSLHLPPSISSEGSKILEAIKQLGMKRPIFNLMQVGINTELSFPITFNLCLSASSVEEMMKSNGETDPCLFIQKRLLQSKSSNQSTEKNCIASKNCPLSVSVVKNNTSLFVTLTAHSFESLIGLRIAVMDALLASQGNCSYNSATYVNIPASIYRRCEEISKSLMNLYGKDVESAEISKTILQLYQELRRDISGKLPIL